MDDLKDRLREFFQTLWGKIQESAAWNQLSEKYQDLSPSGQKAVLGVLGFLAALIIFYIPYSFYSSADTYLEEVDGKKGLIRELYRVTRADQSLPPLPMMMDGGQLESRARAIVTEVGLQPDQIGNVSQDVKGGAGLPKTLEQNGLAMTLNKLNVRQLVDIGSRLQALGPTVKMVGVEIKAAQPDPHYFDVTFKLIGFSVPPEPVAKSPGRAKKSASDGDEE